MRILVIGAGALGGYFGACLVRAGRNVTFLVRQHRAEQLAHDGMQVLSPHGDFKVSPTTVSSDVICEPFDIVLVAVKSYSLDEAMDHFAPAIGSNTIILPILNGMGQIERLSRRFGAERVMGGMANISCGLDAEGRIVQFMPLHDLVYGEILGGFSDRTRALQRVPTGVNRDSQGAPTE